jgi:hypothetical protein
MEIVDGSGWGAPKITHKEMTCLLLAIDCQTLTKKFLKNNVKLLGNFFSHPAVCKHPWWLTQDWMFNFGG